MYTHIHMYTCVKKKKKLRPGVMPKWHSDPKSPAVNQQPSLFPSILSLSLSLLSPKRPPSSPPFHPLLYMTTTQTGITSTQPYFTRAHWDSYRDLIPLHSCQSLHNPPRPDAHTYTHSQRSTVSFWEEWREQNRGENQKEEYNQWEFGPIE